MNRTRCSRPGDAELAADRPAPNEQRGDAGIDSATDDSHEFIPVDGHPTSVPSPARSHSTPRIREAFVPPAVVLRV